jgi:nitroreductase
MDLDKAIKDRHSVRKFKLKKPDWRDIIECIDSARLGPMAGNNFTLRFVLVSEEKSIRKIAEASTQSFVGQAKYILVACSDPTRIINAYGKRGEIFFRQQAGAGLQNFLLKIIEKGLATCWVGAFDEDMVKEELRIPDHVKVEAVFPIGYEQEGPIRRRDKIELDNVLFFNKYKNKKMKPDKKIEA